MRTLQLLIFLLSTPAHAESTTIPITHVHKNFSASFETFTAHLESKLGKFNQDAYESIVTNSAKSADAKKIIEAQQGPSGLMLFAVYDHGSLLTIKKGSPQKAKQYVIGNPLIAATMTEHDIRAALYAPVRILVYQQGSDQTQVEYDLPSSQFGQFHNGQIDKVAKALDAKLEALLHAASADR